MQLFDLYWRGCEFTNLPLVSVISIILSVSFVKTECLNDFAKYKKSFEMFDQLKLNMTCFQRHTCWYSLARHVRCIYCSCSSLDWFITVYRCLSVRPYTCYAWLPKNALRVFDIFYNICLHRIQFALVSRFFISESGVGCIMCSSATVYSFLHFNYVRRCISITCCNTFNLWKQLNSYTYEIHISTFRL